MRHDKLLNANFARSWREQPLAIFRIASIEQVEEMTQRFRPSTYFLAPLGESYLRGRRNRQRIARRLHRSTTILVLANGVLLLFGVLALSLRYVNRNSHVGARPEGPTAVEIQFAPSGRDSRGDTEVLMPQ